MAVAPRSRKVKKCICPFFFEIPISSFLFRVFNFEFSISSFSIFTTLVEAIVTESPPVATTVESDTDAHMVDIPPVVEEPPEAVEEFDHEFRDDVDALIAEAELEMELAAAQAAAAEQAANLEAGMEDFTEPAAENVPVEGGEPVTAPPEVPAEPEVEQGADAVDPVPMENGSENAPGETFDIVDEEIPDEEIMENLTEAERQGRQYIFRKLEK